MLFEAFLGLIDAGIIKREVDGVLLHGAFFLGPKSFYRALREMPPQATRANADDAGVVYQRALWRRGGKRRARVDARFVNNAMMATLDGRGGFRRPGKRPGHQRRRRPVQFRGAGVRACRAPARSSRWKRRGGESRQEVSNIRWNYGHETIPRHLRDIVVTEYGVADLRGKSDAEVIASMLAVADSRFQNDLMRQAKDAGKLPKNYEIPAAHRDNFPNGSQPRYNRRATPACCRRFRSAATSPTLSSG